MLQLYPSWYTDTENPYPSCGHLCPTPPRHHAFLSLGYTYQHPYGFFVGANAYGIIRFPLDDNVWDYPNEYIYPMGGLTVGYRLPSRQLHMEWKERGFKRRILRVMQPKQKKEKKKKEEDEDWFEDQEGLQVDSIEMAEIEAQLAKLRKRQLRHQLEEKRENGRSHVFAEGFGAAGHWSVNYSYTYPVTKSELVALDFRGGIGTGNWTVQIPIHAGVKVMKNYRGTGVYIGVMPSIDWERNTAGAIYFLEHNVEFHFAYGLTGGVTFYLFYDPARFTYSDQFAPYGGFFLGYRLPKMKKN